MSVEKIKYNISVKKDRASLVGEIETLVCGNSDYELIFDFDERWDEYPAKTALFVYGNNSIEKPFDGNLCEGIPIEGALFFAVGVFAGNLKTTTGAVIPCDPSIRDIGKLPTPFTPSEYDSLMELINNYIKIANGAPKGGKVGQVLKKNSDKDYDFGWGEDDKSEIDAYSRSESDQTFVKQDGFDEKVQNIASQTVGKVNIYGFDGVTVDSEREIVIDYNSYDPIVDEYGEFYEFTIKSPLPIKPNSFTYTNTAVGFSWSDDGNGNLVKDGQISGNINYKTGKVNLLNGFGTYMNSTGSYIVEANCIGLETTIPQILSKIAKVENSISGVEEDLAMLNEGGIE